MPWQDTCRSEICAIEFLSFTEHAIKKAEALLRSTTVYFLLFVDWTIDVTYYMYDMTLIEARNSLVASYLADATNIIHEGEAH